VRPVADLFRLQCMTGRFSSTRSRSPDIVDLSSGVHLQRQLLPPHGALLNPHSHITLQQFINYFHILCHTNVAISVTGPRTIMHSDVKIYYPVLPANPPWRLKSSPNIGRLRTVHSSVPLHAAEPLDWNDWTQLAGPSWPSPKNRKRSSSSSEI
jgi:hypothetical protein